MDRAKAIGQLLDKPPYMVTQEIAAIREQILGGYWVNLLCENGIQSYQLHAREALMGDILRLVFVLKAFAREHGSYPASLEELKPLLPSGIPIDPLTGDPIVYINRGQSFTLFGPPVGNIWGEIYWTARN